MTVNRKSKGFVDQAMLSREKGEICSSIKIMFWLTKSCSSISVAKN
jgi:hypothetical protein